MFRNNWRFTGSYKNSTERFPCTFYSISPIVTSYITIVNIEQRPLIVTRWLCTALCHLTTYTHSFNRYLRGENKYKVKIVTLLPLLKIIYPSSIWNSLPWPMRSAPCAVPHLILCLWLPDFQCSNFKIYFLLFPRQAGLALNSLLFTYLSLDRKHYFPSSHITPRSHYEISKPVFCQHLDFLSWITAQFAILYKFVCMFDFCISPPPDGKSHWEGKM